MAFDSYPFWAFLAAGWVLFLLSPGTGFRKALLAGGSLLFYYQEQGGLVVLLLLVTVFTFLAGAGIQRATQPGWRKRFLWLGVGATILILALYKYGGLMGSAGSRLAEFIPGLTGDSGSFVLPLGISYYTIQAIGYLIDCYRRQAPERTSLLDYALFLSFFAHITAGPILRSADFLPQLRERLRLKASLLWESLLLITFGLFKKLVIADNLSMIVDAAFSNLAEASGPQILIATYAYAVQVYCDFSGYTDMAIGAGLLFGLRMPANFRWPYLAASIADFWNRWHITLSHWLRDYVYFSLPGLRSGSALAPYRNLVITMALCGAWHGAGVTFLLWGLYHGLLLAAYRAGQPLWNGLKSRLGRLHYFGAVFFVQQLVVAGWVLFRIEKINDLPLYLRKVTDLGSFLASFQALSLGQKTAAGLLVLFWASQFIHRRLPLTDYMKSNPWNPWALVVVLLVLMSVATFTLPIPIPFLYFRF